MNQLALSPQQVQQLKAEGYSEMEIQEALNEISREDTMKSQYQMAKGGMSSPMMKPSAFSNYNPNDNLIKWQLELNEILDRTEHILRGDILKIDKNNNQVWGDNPKPDENPLNEYGVQECMRVLSMYLTRNTILGNHTGEEVDDIVYDFGKELNDLYFTQYEIMGMETVEKRKKYPMYFLMMKDVVWNAYTRSIGAGERGSLREARQIQQNEQLSPTGANVNINTQPAMMQKRGLFNPMRYIVGKYK